MELFDLLRPEAVKVVFSVSSKKRLIQSIGELASVAYGLELKEVTNVLIERENLGPTGVGSGVALPHARLDALDRVVGAFVLLEQPIDFGSFDNQPVDLIFSLFAPKNAGVEHLKSLALVSRTLRKKNFCAKLRSNRDSSTLYTILTADQNEAVA